MRMIFTNHIADDASGLFIGLVEVVRQHIHRKQHPAMYRLQSVSHIRQSPPYDYAHGIGEIGFPHLTFKCDRRHLFGKFRHALEIP